MFNYRVNIDLHDYQSWYGAMYFISYILLYQVCYQLKQFKEFFFLTFFKAVFT